MAKDGGVKAPKGTTPIDPVEEFFKSEQGQDIDRLFNEFSTGKKTYDQVYDEYHQKWSNRPPQVPAPGQVPDAPYLPIR